MGSSRQEYWSGLPFPSPGDLPNPGIEPPSPALAGGRFTTEPPGKPPVLHSWHGLSSAHKGTHLPPPRGPSRVPWRPRAVQQLTLVLTGISFPCPSLSFPSCAVSSRLFSRHLGPLLTSCPLSRVSNPASLPAVNETTAEPQVLLRGRPAVLPAFSQPDGESLTMSPPGLTSQTAAA